APVSPDRDRQKKRRKGERHAEIGVEHVVSRPRNGRVKTEGDADEGVRDSPEKIPVRERQDRDAADEPFAFVAEGNGRRRVRYENPSAQKEKRDGAESGGERDVPRRRTAAHDRDEGERRGRRRGPTRQEL